MVVQFWLRPGNTACVLGAEVFVTQTLARLPATMRVGLLRADSGFCADKFLRALEAVDQHYIVALPMRSPTRFEECEEQLDRTTTCPLLELLCRESRGRVSD